MIEPGRKFVQGAKKYRFSFNGKENDNEVKGEGNQQDYGMRIYDPRLGKFLSVDPLTKSYPHYTPYSFAGNKPIQFIDLDGAEEMPTNDKRLNLQNRFGTALNKITGNDVKIKLASASLSVFSKLDAFEIKGRSLSAYNMYRYLEGKSGYDIYSYDAIEKSSFLTFWSVNRTARTNIVQDIERSASILASEKGKGIYYGVTSETSVQRGQSAALISDLGTAFGSFEVLAKGIFTISVDEKGNYTYSGNVFYTFRDKYRWHAGRGKDGGGDDGVNHSKMIQLKSIGAQDFYIRAYYYQSVKGANNKVFTTDGNIQDSPDPSYHPDPQGQYYSMPENSQKINDFRKTG